MARKNRKTRKQPAKNAWRNRGQGVATAVLVPIVHMGIGAWEGLVYSFKRK